MTFVSEATLGYHVCVKLLSFYSTLFEADKTQLSITELHRELLQISQHNSHCASSSIIMDGVVRSISPSLWRMMVDFE